MRVFRIWAYVFAALASMSVGVEVERFLSAEQTPVQAPASSLLPEVSGAEKSASTPSMFSQALDWEPLSTRALWEALSPGTLEWFETVGPEQVHDGVWNSAVVPLLGWPPAFWLAALSIVSFLLARLRSGQQLPSPGGLRSGVRWIGLLLAGVGFGVIGADLYQTGGAWDPRPLGDLWKSVHPDSFAAWQQDFWFEDALGWPAWIVLVGVGALLAFLARPRPSVLMYPYPPGVVPARGVDLSRTLAYLDSVRSWPPGSRKRARVEASETPE